jgi:hypothetical protein
MDRRGRGRDQIGAAVISFLRRQRHHPNCVPWLAGPAGSGVIGELGPAGELVRSDRVITGFLTR